MKNSRTLILTLLALSGQAATRAAAQTADWNNPLGGTWNTAANWSPAAVPNTPAFDAAIGLTDAFTVLLNINTTINSLAITNPLATLDMPGSRSLTLNAGLHNSGLIRINSDSTIFDASLNFSQTAAITGSGEINLGAAAGNPDIRDAQINAAEGATLTIGADQLLSGNGTMGGPGSFVAQGIIRPTGPATPGIQLRTSLTLGPAAEIDLTNARFDLGVNASLTNARIIGANPLRATGSAVRIAGLTLDAPFDIPGAATTVSIDASIINNNTISINPDVAIFNAVVRFDADADITGVGSIRMLSAGNTDDAQITTAAGVTGGIGPGQAISGSGRLAGDIILLGSVTADDPAVPFELRGSLSGPGLIRAENDARLSFVSADLSDLTIETASGGTVGADSGVTTIAGITNNGQAYIAGGSTTLALNGPMTNNGTLTINSTDQIFNAILRFDAPVAIGGTGSIAMRTAGNTNDAQITTAAGITGVIGAGQTVSGSGRIGGDIVLLGSVTADNPDANLELRGNLSGPGLLRAENGGFLSFFSAELTDMTVETTGDGIVGARSGVTTATGIINNGSMVVAGNAATLAIGSDLINNGTITLNFDNQIFDALLRIDADVAIEGPGTIFMQTAGATNDASIQVTDTFTATIGSDQTVRGSGLIIGSYINNGTINADDPALNLDLRASISGAGTIRADGGRATMANATISGQNFTTSSGGLVTARSGLSTIQDTINSGTLGIDGNAATVVVLGSMVNNGTIDINVTETIFDAFLELADPAGISGSGEIVLRAAGNTNDAQIRVPSGQTSTLGQGQTLSGSGRINGDLGIAGTVRPAGNLRQIEILAGAVELGDTAIFELGGTAPGEFGRFTLVSTASIELGGTCVVRLDDGYQPELGDSWNIISGTNITGRFDAYDLPAAPFGSVYRIFQEPGRVYVRLTCAADFDGDRILNFFDLNRFLSYYNDQDPRADLAFPQGVFNFFDITTFISNFNAGCP